MSNDDAFDFPCAFPIKVFGHNEDAFRNQAWEIVSSRYPDLSAADVAEKVSRNGRFLSITFTVEAQNRENLDDLYEALSSDPLILMAL